MLISGRRFWKKIGTMLYKRKVAYGIFVAFVLYLMLRLRKYTIKFESDIRKSKPIDVWEYVSDYGNMQKLNPTIVDFTVHEEMGDYTSWIYTVSYTEFLSYLPFIYNHAKAEIRVVPGDDKYFIDSTHNTCFFASFACVKSWSKFIFEPSEIHEKATHCTENVTYECPAILSLFCEKEVLYQRRMIVANLQQEFSRLSSEMKS